jgi:hypothetical protein
VSKRPKIGQVGTETVVKGVGDAENEVLRTTTALTAHHVRKPLEKANETVGVDEERVKAAEDAVNQSIQLI